MERRRRWKMEKRRWRTRCLVFVPNTQVETKGSDLTCNVSTHHATHHQIVILYWIVQLFTAVLGCWTWGGGGRWRGGRWRAGGGWLINVQDSPTYIRAGHLPSKQSSWVMVDMFMYVSLYCSCVHGTDVVPLRGTQSTCTGIIQTVSLDINYGLSVLGC